MVLWTRLTLDPERHSVCEKAVDSPVFEPAEIFIVLTETFPNVLMLDNSERRRRP
jgi:hypothetical protein